MSTTVTVIPSQQSRCKVITYWLYDRESAVEVVDRTIWASPHVLADLLEKEGAMLVYGRHSELIFVEEK